MYVSFAVNIGTRSAAWQWSVQCVSVATCLTIAVKLVPSLLTDAPSILMQSFLVIAAILSGAALEYSVKFPKENNDRPAQLPLYERRASSSSNSSTNSNANSSSSVRQRCVLGSKPQNHSTDTLFDV
ncbi:hypothetical protein B9Z55_007603 [Caenorhabditis nigoni]|uniref:Uncharacterized protein n=1 Tax=Caenorhabditis nigoni TaxID=1611254 RepID=A0A2G5VAC0_9PELO|nr:hypothetical protein B9Z55_007603 [Caenorhabditis nigoni]